MRLTTDDHGRIATAIQQAEANTSGEVFCVIARSVSSYQDVGLAWAAAAAFILPLALVPLGFDPAWLPGLADTWEPAHLAARDFAIARSIGAYAVIQAAVFLAFYLLGRIPTVKRWMTPRSVRRHRTRQAALRQFMAHGLHLTEQRTGVLLFACAADHQVEVLADQGIHDKVDPEVWGEAVKALTAGLAAKRPVDGFEKAIALCGDVLAAHFPPRPNDINELPDRLVEI
ncbi:TPM domain-containing protein [Brevundimonas sp. Leaf363]|uniref:TPM domain-containing protein n=1 Tax=Brevundimonas sp. Leaf363 TaxID=1736353 RepID=UPI000AC80AC1|nr:TPM domain-containing protein [Brevundimonas sp. Leaf363]